MSIMVDDLDHCLTFSIPSGGGGGGNDTTDNDINSTPSGNRSSFPLTIRLHQAANIDTDQGENETNTGFVMWPAAVMLAHYLNSHPIIVLSDSSRPRGNIMELGSGCGLAGLTAARMLDERSLRVQQQQQQQSSSSSAAAVCVNINDRVIFTDYNPACLVNLRRNMILNKLNSIHEVLGLDWFDQKMTPLLQVSKGVGSSSSSSSSNNNDNNNDNNNNNNTWIDMDGALHSQCRLIIGADLIVCSNDAALVASTINCALLEGGQAIILGADKYTRFGVCSFPEACRDLGLLVTVQEGMLESRNNDNVDDIASTCLLMDTLVVGGYHRGSQSYGYDFTLFTINKPIAPVGV